jgi:uncharacterized DUF497 family protein
LRYEWNEKKNVQNLKKYGVTFEEAQVIWSDKKALEFIDNDHSIFECRFIRIGLNPRRGILLAIFCERQNEEVVGIISARKANQEERGEYEGQL